ncbi:hypothetical protein LXA43DRAFT_1091798 [Ganoderma leucocontextum]|nr:hypothetical protein LXA43DRAFT_1091798 [Ganoderma leucocontextum]
MRKMLSSTLGRAKKAVLVDSGGDEESGSEAEGGWESGSVDEDGDIVVANSSDEHSDVERVGKRGIASFEGKMDVTDRECGVVRGAWTSGAEWWRNLEHKEDAQERFASSEAPAAKRAKTTPAATPRASTRAQTTRAQTRPAQTTPTPPAPSKTTLGRRLVKTTLGMKGPIGDGESTNGFCYGCQNGGVSIACDECPRILCFRHAPQIAAVDQDTRETLNFRCPSCHTKKTQSLNMIAPYYGLYHPPGGPEQPERPYFADWVKLHLVAARPQHVQVDTRPILILSVRLATLPETNNPARLLFNHLVPWFEGSASGGLRYIDLPFDMSEPAHATKYRNKWDKELAALGLLTNTRIMLFIYNHSHEETGDLFYGEDTCSVSLAQWWADVISPGLRQIATSGQNQLTIAMLVCGSLLSNDAPRRELVAAVNEMRATHMFAFVTERLQPVLTTQFFQAFALRHLLEGATLSAQLMAALLEQSSSLARHSAVWHILRPAGETELMMRKGRRTTTAR